MIKGETPQQFWLFFHAQVPSMGKVAMTTYQHHQPHAQLLPNAPLLELSVFLPRNSQRSSSIQHLMFLYLQHLAFLLFAQTITNGLGHKDHNSNHYRTWKLGFNQTWSQNLHVPALSGELRVKSVLKVFHTLKGVRVRVCFQMLLTGWLFGYRRVIPLTPPTQHVFRRVTG